jgi:hypothetical protein
MIMDVEEKLDEIIQKVSSIDTKLNRLEVKTDKMERLVRPVVEKVLGE